MEGGCYLVRTSIRGRLSPRLDSGEGSVNEEKCEGWSLRVDGESSEDGFLGETTHTTRRRGASQRASLLYIFPLTPRWTTATKNIHTMDSAWRSDGAGDSYEYGSTLINGWECVRSNAWST